MVIDDEDSITNSVSEIPAAAISDNHAKATIDASLVLPLQTTISPIIAPPVAPSIASIPPPLAPLPPRPPVLRPPQPQNGESKEIDSDSEHDESGPAGGSTAEYEVSEHSRMIRERQEKAMQEFMLKRRAAALAVPTNDMSVRARLRRLGEPITLFGEKEMERRARLRDLMARLDSEGQLEKLMKAHEDEEAVSSSAMSDGTDEEIQYPFYTEGSRALLEARLDIARYSLEMAALRLKRVKRKRDDPDENVDTEIELALDQASSLVMDCSEIGDDRPLSGCSFSNDGTILATCAFSGVAKLWSMPRLEKLTNLKGHTERITDVAFSTTDTYVATASADRTTKLWNTEGTLLRTYEGHLDRLARIAFHPSGKYLGTTSFDNTWRLWDVETGNELLLQEGHSRSVYGIGFHHDGSLVSSCGLDSLVRVWDLRSGRSILIFEGHVKPVYGVSFSPNGYHLASGGEDNSCRIWDLRKRKSLYTIPAHSNLISEVKFEPQEGYFFMTASFDMTAKVWSSKDFKPVKTLSGHEAKVTSLDIVEDGQYVATVSHDRTIKLWSGRNNDEKEKYMEVDSFPY